VSAVIDWFAGYVGYDGSGLRLGLVVGVGPDGVVRWQRETWETAKGSFESGIQISREGRTRQMAAETDYLCSPMVLRLGGNPAKFLQGHNVYGPSVSDLGPVIQAVVRGLPPTMRPRNADDPQLPAVQRGRVDVTVMVDLGAHEHVHEWLRTAATATRSRHGRAVVSGSTVYWGKSSTRWSLKAYCKFCELAEHRPLGDYGLLRNWCETMLRIELTLRRPELKNRGTLSEAVVWEFYKRLVIGVGETEQLDARLAESGLSWQLQDTLELWLEGKDVRRRMPRTTLWRYRRLVMDRFGVDISLPRADQWEDIAAVGFDVEYLKAREVKTYPRELPPWGVAATA
jgi:Phage replication protein CRI